MHCCAGTKEDVLRGKPHSESRRLAGVVLETKGESTRVSLHCRHSGGRGLCMCVGLLFFVWFVLVLSEEIEDGVPL
jgi:hypothetical protein